MSSGAADGDMTFTMGRDGKGGLACLESSGERGQEKETVETLFACITNERTLAIPENSHRARALTFLDPRHGPCCMLPVDKYVRDIFFLTYISYWQREALYVYKNIYMYIIDMHMHICMYIYTYVLGPTVSQSFCLQKNLFLSCDLD